MRHSVGPWALLATGLLPAAALATTLLFQDLPTKARQADVVVQGTVVSSEARWSGDGRRIFTDTVIAVAETWKGEAPARVTVRQPGGVVAEIGQRVDGVASFRDGEEVVLFLEARPGGAFLLHGMAQGKYRIERPGDGGPPTAVPEATGEALLVDPVTRQRQVVSAEVLELAALRRAVAQAVGTAPEEAPPPGQKIPAPRTGKPAPR
jgi:hypothetical protein